MLGTLHRSCSVRLLAQFSLSSTVGAQGNVTGLGFAALKREENVKHDDVAFIFKRYE